MIKIAKNEGVLALQKVRRVQILARDIFRPALFLFAPKKKIRGCFRPILVRNARFEPQLKNMVVLDTR
jgi:hypothetical protein